ncbi:MAG: PQQ-binding-like beta-propeller repeat protein [Verrucomicrobiota bacterium]|nr:PQQ-binding-like beta-propeller repeat protein [Verrucomicrobiota bacterium]
MAHIPSANTDLINNRHRILLVLLCAGLVLEALRADWAQFRGPNASGIAEGQAPPLEFGPGKNELWRLDVNSGHSSPCVVGDVLFLTTFDAELQQLAVLCLDRHTGREKWERIVPSTYIEKGHPSFNPASSTPASDGDCVVAYFGSFGLICFDLQGVKRWEIPMPLAKSFAGNAISPVIFGDQVFLYRGNYVDHYLLAVDKLSGEERWRVPQDEPFAGELACTATPVMLGQQLIVHSARAVQAFDPVDGRRIWITQCATTATTVPVIAGDEVIVAAWNQAGEPALRPQFPGFQMLLDKHDGDEDGSISKTEFPRLWMFHRPLGAEAPMNGATVRFERADADGDAALERDEWVAHVNELEKIRSRYRTHGMLAIRTDSEGFLHDHQIRVLEKRGIPEVPSPLVHNGLVYFVKNGGLLTCLDLETGRRLYQERTGGRGTHYASPVIAGNRLLTVAGNGQISVMNTGPEFKSLAMHAMGDNVYATPAIVDGTLYIRTWTTLFAFRDRVDP